MGFFKDQYEQGPDSNLYLPKGKMLKASSLSISQAIVAQLTMWSNGNVVMQCRSLPLGDDPLGAAAELRFYCGECKEAKTFGFSDFLDTPFETWAQDKIVGAKDWIVKHAHAAPVPIPAAPVTEERKLKVVI